MWVYLDLMNGWVNYLFKEKKVIVMSKGIAIQTILYLLLGIIVVGIIVYLVYTYTTGGQLNEQQCRSRIITWCTGCSVANWANGAGELPSATVGDVERCIETYFGTGAEWSGAECDQTDDGVTNTQTFCNAFI